MMVQAVQAVEAVRVLFMYGAQSHVQFMHFVFQTLLEVVKRGWVAHLMGYPAHLEIVAQPERQVAHQRQVG